MCPDHEQHSRLALIEITDHCNLSCPVCFAESSPARTSYRSLETIERMLDALVMSEGEPDLVQISGGEPTLHPDFFAILDAVRTRPIRHVMIKPTRTACASRRTPNSQKRLADNKKGANRKSTCSSVPVQRDALVKPARRRSAPHPATGAGDSRTAGAVDDAGRDRQARRQRRGDRRHRAPCPDLALRARHHLSAGAGRRPQRALQQGHRPHDAVGDPPPRGRDRRVRRCRHDPAAVQSREHFDRLRTAQRRGPCCRSCRSCREGAARSR